LNEVEEEFAQLEFRSPTLDKLRNAILRTHAPQPDLDADTLKRQLEENGYSGTVDAVLSPQVLSHAAFARVGADAETARCGWSDAKGRFEHRRLDGQIKDAVRDLSAEMNEANWVRTQPLLEGLSVKDRDEGTA
jgi:DNA primase